MELIACSEFVCVNQSNMQINKINFDYEWDNLINNYIVNAKLKKNKTSISQIGHFLIFNKYHDAI